MKANIKDVAREAGVSIATVSRVLNNKDRVKDSTRERVESAVQKLNFQPDPIARTMIMKETRSVGLLVPALSGEYWARLAEVIQDKLWEYGYTMMLCVLGDRRTDREEAYLKAFADRRMDGILWGTFLGDTIYSTPMFSQLKDSGIPMVMLDSVLPGIHRVGGDQQRGAMLAIDHLFDLGHRRIAYIHGSPKKDDRELGYMSALMLHGLPVDESLIVKTSYGIDYGKQAAETLIQRGTGFTAAFCWNDLTAMGFIRGLEAAGRIVPQDIAVIGFDDISTADLFTPRLTTIRQPVSDIAETMVSLLVDTIENKNNPTATKSITVQMQLVVRESCGVGLKQSGM